MQVKERMTTDPVTVSEETGFQEALRLMREKRVRRLPVLDRSGKLVGIVAEKDLLYASPSPATSLSVYELNYLLSKIQVKDVMTRRVITVGEDCPLEDAARIMVDNKIGGLPIMRGDKLVGIITETGIFRAFAEVLGGGLTGLRVTLDVAEGAGVLARVTGAITAIGGNIVTLATFQGKDAGHRYLAIKVQGVGRDALVQALVGVGQVTDIQELVEGYLPRVIERR